MGVLSEVQRAEELFDNGELDEALDILMTIEEADMVTEKAQLAFEESKKDRAILKDKIKMAQENREREARVASEASYDPIDAYNLALTKLKAGSPFDLKLLVEVQDLLEKSAERGVVQARTLSHKVKAQIAEVKRHQK